MEMKRLAGGNLRAAGYDDRRSMLVVELTSGTFEYGGVSQDTYRRLVSASSPWSFFRDNIDEEYPAKRIR
jgi:KTSC domain-containing protein